jgi:hypothetical protein
MKVTFRRIVEDDNIYKGRFEDGQLVQGMIIWSDGFVHVGLFSYHEHGYAGELYHGKMYYSEKYDLIKIERRKQITDDKCIEEDKKRQREHEMLKEVIQLDDERESNQKSFFYVSKRLDSLEHKFNEIIRRINDVASEVNKLRGERK